MKMQLLRWNHTKPKTTGVKKTRQGRKTAGFIIWIFVSQALDYFVTEKLYSPSAFVRLSSANTPVICSVEPVFDTFPLYDWKVSLVVMSLRTKLKRPVAGQ